MVSAVIKWKGVSQPFFTGGNGIKVNGASYLKHFCDDLIPAVEAMHPNKDFTFVQDSAPSHRPNQVQNFLKEKLKSRFVKKTYWPPKLRDCNPLDYYCWDRVEEKVNNGRTNTLTNKYIYWTLCDSLVFHEIIVSQFSCNHKKLDRKRQIEIIFSRQNFHFSRVVIFFLIGIHSMQGWTAPTSHGVTRKEAQKKITGYRKSA